MSNRSLMLRFLVLAVLLSLPLTAFADKPIGKLTGGGSAVEWLVDQPPYDRIELRVVDPCGEVYARTFKYGVNPTFRLSDLDVIDDGAYTYELRLLPNVPIDLIAKLKELRNAGDDTAARRLMCDTGLNTSITQAGAFTVLRGLIIRPDLIETSAARPPSNSSSVTATHGGVETDARPGDVQVNDQVIPDDLITQGSLCVGFDCVNGESFGFDTIRLKENNLRIHFDDTSTLSGFPKNDWRIIANDSASGGASKFSIEDSTAARVPFTVEAGATANSLVVDHTGRIGFRTAAPVLDLHINTSNTPGIRLEQNSSGGFSAQTWDIAGNETNFFVRDVTGGSRLPFRIRPGAPTSAIDINGSGDVGIGTSSPSEKLHVRQGTAGEDANTFILVENPHATGTSAAAIVRAKSDTAAVNFQAHGSARTLSRFGQTLGGWSEMLQVSGNGLILGTNGNVPMILGTNATARMTIAGSGAITVPGDFTVTGVKNFAMVDPDDSSKALYYTALEGPEAGTYCRGSAKTVDGQVVIDLPGSFAKVTESERLTVQLCPIGSWGQLYVAEKSPHKLVIRVADGSPDLEFDYLVQGVRKGYLNYEVERDGAFPVSR